MIQCTINFHLVQCIYCSFYYRFSYSIVAGVHSVESRLVKDLCFAMYDVHHAVIK